MGWRFRKSFTPIPGVRLNLSRRGFSTTLGVGPLSINLGPRGSAVNASIPGTGISFRQPIRFDPGTVSGSVPPAAGVPASPGSAPTVPTLPEGEIRSAGTSEMTSEGLEPFKDLIHKAQRERDVLLPELELAQAAAERLRAKHDDWEQGWLFRRIFPGSFGRLGERAAEAQARYAELQQQEELSRVETQIEVPEAVRMAFARLSDDFVHLASAHAVWDTLSRATTDRVRERTTAAHTVERTAVKFKLGSCDLVQSEWKVPHLSNANGGDLYLYPGFVLYHVAGHVFAVIDASEVDLGYSGVAFIEEEPIPADSRTIGSTWKKANKDGSPDRRFAGNYQIPVIEYGGLRLVSPQGLNEEYMVSNAAAAERFARSFQAFQAVIRSATA